MHVNLRIFALTFGILALELALIRWTAGQVRIFAYFGNLVLIVVFLGLGVGTALGRNGRSFLHWAFPALLILSIALAFAPQLNMTQMEFPNPSVATWGGITVEYSIGEIFRNVSIFVALILTITVIFICIGTELGSLFSQAGDKSVDAYAADLGGSLAGTLCFAAITLLHTPPPLWLLLGTAPLVVLQPHVRNIACGCAVVVLGWTSIQGALYSPYNRIDISNHQNRFAINVDVNRDFHQTIWNFSERSLQEAPNLEPYKLIYDIPMTINPKRRSVVIVGAGTGNDAQAAVRNGYETVIAVDIDPVIIALGAELHPQKPYTDGGVTTVIDDARAFFRRYDGPKFDAVVYGLLDSHAMASAMSSIRLDNFVYTVEGIRDAWRHVAEDGHLAVGFSVVAGLWMAERLNNLLTEATGIEPLVMYHGLHYGTTFIVSSNKAVMDAENFDSLRRRLNAARLTFAGPHGATRIPTDDWPYLYVRPGVFPWLYLFIVGLIAVAAMVSIPLAFGRGSMRSHFDPTMFLIGAAFLLLETRGVTALSLLFGSTWIVNAFVFTGILTMALATTLIVRKYRSISTTPLFIALVLSTVALWQFDLSALNALPFIVRGIVGGLIHAVPVFFAGLLFPILLSKSSNPAASLGSNLLGAVLGGCMEYSSMLFGLKALVAFAAILYLTAFLIFNTSQRARSTVEVKA